MINIIVNKLIGTLCRRMADYTYLRENADEWRKELVHMDFITTEFQSRNLHLRQDDSGDRGKKHTVEDRVHVQETLQKKDRPQSHSEGDRVPREVKYKSNKEGRYCKCGMSNHKFEACHNEWQANTAPFRSDAGREPVNKKARMDE